jgi:hypothetical protein
MGQNGSVSYSVGQVFINTPTGITSFLQEGVQQPLEIIIIPGTKDVRGIGLAVHAYPNPVRRTLTLKIHDKGFQEFNFYLCDMNGKILKANKIVNSETFIPMEEYPPSTYYLRVTEGSDEIKLFKIIKTN